MKIPQRFLLLFSVLWLSACSIEKRLHNPGYSVRKHGRYHSASRPGEAAATGERNDFESAAARQDHLPEAGLTSSEEVMAPADSFPGTLISPAVRNKPRDKGGVQTPAPDSEKMISDPAKSLKNTASASGPKRDAPMAGGILAGLLIVLIVLALLLVGYVFFLFLGTLGVVLLYIFALIALVVLIAGFVGFLLIA